MKSRPNRNIDVYEFVKLDILNNYVQLYIVPIDNQRENTVYRLNKK